MKRNATSALRNYDPTKPRDPTTAIIGAIPKMERREETINDKTKTMATPKRYAYLSVMTNLSVVSRDERLSRPEIPKLALQ